MASWKATKLDEKRNHLTVEFTFDDNSKRKVRFDNNHLPQDEAGLDEYMKDWVEAYERGKAAVNPNAAG